MLLNSCKFQIGPMRTQCLNRLYTVYIISLYYLNYTINIVFMGLPPIFRWLVLILFESMVLCLFLLKSAAAFPVLFWGLESRSSFTTCEL